MFFVLEKDCIKKTGQQEWEKSSEGIGLFNSEEWGEQLALKEEFSLEQCSDNIYFCKLESYALYLFGTFHIPVKKKERKHSTFAIYILDGKIIFIDDSGLVKQMIEKLQKRTLNKPNSLERFLYDFLMMLIEEDILYLTTIEREIAEMEEQILRGKTENFNYKMLRIKKEISRLYCYYSQMTDVGEILCENAHAFFGKEDVLAYDIFTERSQRLQQEAQVLREYAMQVQDVYQSEIGIRQNDIMKVLTIVTTIFLPLTLIAGWYGMNFYNMPELEWKYSYPVVTVISILIVIFTLWFFKKKKLF